MKERLVFHDLYGSEREGEGGSSCSPKARCLSRPVIRAGGEFRIAVPSAAKGRISVNPREFNVINKGHVT